MLACWVWSRFVRIDYNILQNRRCSWFGNRHTKRKGRSVLNGKRIFRHPKTNSFAVAVCRVEKRNCYSFSPSLLPPNCCFSKPFMLFCIRSRVVRSLKTSVRCVFVPCCMVRSRQGEAGEGQILQRAGFLLMCLLEKLHAQNNVQAIFFHMSSLKIGQITLFFVMIDFLSVHEKQQS